MTETHDVEVKLIIKIEDAFRGCDLRPALKVQACTVWRETMTRAKEEIKVKQARAHVHLSISYQEDEDEIDKTENGDCQLNFCPRF